MSAARGKEALHKKCKDVGMGRMSDCGLRIAELEFSIWNDLEFRISDLGIGIFNFGFGIVFLIVEFWLPIKKDRQDFPSPYIQKPQFQIPNYKFQFPNPKSEFPLPNSHFTTRSSFESDTTSSQTASLSCGEIPERSAA